MRRTNFNLLHLFILGLLLIVAAAINTTPAFAQFGNIPEDRRIDVGYKLKGFAYSYVPNQYYDGGQSLIRKGFVTATYKHYLTDHIFYNLDGGFLLQNQQTSFFGGPIDFNAAELGSAIGVRWGNVSLYTGLTGGLNWNYEIRFKSSTGETLWKEAKAPHHSLYGGIRAGFKYHLFSFLTLKSEIRNTHYNTPNIEPVAGPARIPAIEEAQLAQFSASVGISIGIPWSKRSQNPPENSSYPSNRTPVTEATNTGDANAVAETAEGNAEPAAPPEPPPITRPPESVPAPLAFSNPVGADHIVTSPFGDNRGHEGWDIDLNIGDTVKAVMDGRVSITSWVGAYGKMVELQHPAGFSTRYAHLSKVLVQNDDRVDRGDPIGLGGNSGRSTGPHLHFELLRHGFPVNPRPFLPLNWGIQDNSPLGY